MATDSELLPKGCTTFGTARATFGEVISSYRTVAAQRQCHMSFAIRTRNPDNMCSLGEKVCAGSTGTPRRGGGPHLRTFGADPETFGEATSSYLRSSGAARRTSHMSFAPPPRSVDSPWAKPPGRPPRRPQSARRPTVSTPTHRPTPAQGMLLTPPPAVASMRARRRASSATGHCEAKANLSDDSARASWSTPSASPSSGSSASCGSDYYPAPHPPERPFAAVGTPEPQEESRLEALLRDVREAIEAGCAPEPPPPPSAKESRLEALLRDVRETLDDSLSPLPSTAATLGSSGGGCSRGRGGRGHAGSGRTSGEDDGGDKLANAPPLQSRIQLWQYEPKAAAKGTLADIARRTAGQH